MANAPAAKSLQRIVNGDLLHPELVKALPLNGLIIVAGGLGSGKSALSYALLEYYRYRNPRTSVFVYGFPGDAKHLLPDWVQICPNNEFPEDSILLVDEAYISFGSRESQSKANKWINKFSGLVRQKNILAIFISQTLHTLDKGVLTKAQLILFKKISLLQKELDRSELRKKLNQVFEEFRRARNNGRDYRKAVYLISDETDEEKIVLRANGLPTFWTEELSNAWKGVEFNG